MKKNLKETIKDIVRESISEMDMSSQITGGTNSPKVGYKVHPRRGGSQAGSPVMAGMLEFPFAKYPEHKALESAIERASEIGGTVFVVHADGSKGEVVWPEGHMTTAEDVPTNMNEDGGYEEVGGDQLGASTSQKGYAVVMPLSNDDHKTLELANRLAQKIGGTVISVNSDGSMGEPMNEGYVGHIYCNDVSVFNEMVYELKEAGCDSILEKREDGNHTFKIKEEHLETACEKLCLHEDYPMYNKIGQIMRVKYLK